MNTNSDGSTAALIDMTPVKILSDSMEKVAQAISQVANDGDQQRVIQLVDRAQSLLKAISLLNQ